MKLNFAKPLILKSCLAMALMVFGNQVFAGFQPTQKPIFIHCVGPKGELSLVGDTDKNEMKLAIMANGKTKLIEIDAIKALKHNSNSHVTSTYFTYDNPSEDFISIDASFEKPQWFPPTTKCMPTRAPTGCIPVKYDGYWSSITSEEVSLTFKLNSDGTYLLTSLRAEDYGIKDWHIIGENVACSGVIL